MSWQDSGRGEVRTQRQPSFNPSPRQYDARPMSSSRQPQASGGYGGGSNAGNGGSRWAAAAQAAEQRTSNYGGGGGNGSSTGFRSWENVDEEPEDYDSSGWLERKTKKVQNDSLHGTRRALARLNEADNLASSNLTRLHSQSEQLYKVDSRLEAAEDKAQVGDAKADHLKSLNRYFFLPSFGGKKAGKKEEKVVKGVETRAARDESHLDNHRREREQRFQDIQNRDYSSSTRGMYSTPDGIERDNTEEEIDGNLDQISSGLARLKMMSQAMNSELGTQTQMIGRISDRSDRTGERLRNTSRKIDNIK
ncbi:hypothetical protein DFS34DRAFT_636773 [Phlyctochytrium arcticum]|nr:hypothetical protein DFS34DRAFT_636773 [Phlyctochytrium arcticum]